MENTFRALVLTLLTISLQTTHALPEYERELGLEAVSIAIGGLRARRNP